MTREIKFRAWDRKSQKMFPVHVMGWGEISNKLDYVRGVDIHDPDSDFRGNVTYGGSVRKMTGNPLKPKFELMQYTGLHDKNGVEIYEGDLLKDEFDRNFHVYWVDKEGRFTMRERNRKTEYFMIINHLSVEVIGNIYENPELIETESE